MITKELFEKCINAYKKYDDYETMLSNWGINIWERDEVGELKTVFFHLLNYCCQESSESLSSIEEFIFNPAASKFKSIEELWNYINNKHASADNISKDKIKINNSSLSVEELREIYLENFSK